MRLPLLLLACAAAALAQRKPVPANQYNGWPHYHGGPENLHYTTLAQITPANVGKLKVAWSIDTKEAFEGSEIQCNPIVLDGVVYATSPKLRVMALDGATVVGYAGMLEDEHGLTTVARSHRGRGLATYLKRRQLAWASSAGVAELVTRILPHVRRLLDG